MSACDERARNRYATRVRLEDPSFTRCTTLIYLSPELFVSIWTGSAVGAAAAFALAAAEGAGVDVAGDGGAPQAANAAAAKQTAALYGMRLIPPPRGGQPQRSELNEEPKGNAGRVQEHVHRHRDESRE